MSAPERAPRALPRGGEARVWEKGDGRAALLPRRAARAAALARVPRPARARAARDRAVAAGLPGRAGPPRARRRRRLDRRDARPARGRGRDGADLVGASVGATLAAEVAAFSRASVRRLVLISPFGLFDAREPVRDVFALRKNEVAGCSARDPATLRGVPRAARRRGRDRVAGRADRARAGGGRAPALADRRSRAREAPAPHRRADAARLGRPGPRRAGELREALRRRARRPGADAPIEGAGHMAELDAPDALADAVLEFLG